MRNPVRTWKLKFDGRAKGYWSGDLVEATDDWLVVYHEAPPYSIDGQPVAHAMQAFGLRAPLSVLACFDEQGRTIEWQCDASLPARIEGPEISFVDLDLDLMWRPGEEPYERDHDVFARRRVEMHYSEEAVAAAVEGLRLARELLESGSFPFDGSLERALGAALAARGPV